MPSHMTSRHRVPCSTNPDEALQVFVMRDVQGEDENPLLNQHLEEIGLARFECPQMEEEGGEGEELSASPPPPSDDSESSPGWNSAFETKQSRNFETVVLLLVRRSGVGPDEGGVRGARQHHSRQQGRSCRARHQLQ